MLGLNDRIALREPAPEKSDTPADKKNDKNARKPNAKPADAKSQSKDNAGDATGKRADKAADSELPPDDAEAPPLASPEVAPIVLHHDRCRWPCVRPSQLL